MSKEKESGIFMLLLLILLPYLMTVVVSGREACPVSRKIDLEEFTAAAAAAEISWDYSAETIKAQTILARTNLYAKQAQGKEAECIEYAADSMKNKDMNGEMLKKYQVFQDAAAETKGQILKLNDEIKELPYHGLSQGKTRDGREVLGESFAYIPSVETPKDIDSPLYVEGCYFSLTELEERIQKYYPAFALGEEAVIEIKASDSAGYVMEIQLGNQEFQGEKLREILGLPSSCFTVQRLEEEVRFLCKGKGHGMGLSQYTAEQMALEGKGYEEILKYFFPEMQIGEIR